MWCRCYDWSVSLVLVSTLIWLVRAVMVVGCTPHFLSCPCQSLQWTWNVVETLLKRSTSTLLREKYNSLVIGSRICVIHLKATQCTKGFKRWSAKPMASYALDSTQGCFFLNIKLVTCVTFSQISWSFTTSVTSVFKKYHKNT